MVVFGSAVVVMPFLVTCARLAEDHVTGMHRCDRVLLVADEPDRSRIADELTTVPERRADLVGVLGPDAASTLHGGCPVSDLARASGATVVVLCRQAFADESVVAQVSLLHEAGVRIRTVPAFSEEWLGKVPVSELERTSLLFDVGEVHDGRYGPVKRLLDVALALPGLVALAAAVPFVVVGNVIGRNRGPLLFRQERVGKGGSTFRMVKFRTMPPGSDARWTTQDDERLGAFGRFLRRTHIDELPQVVNILRGELSVVGPRPEQPAYVDELSRKLPFYDVRHLVRPGLTGWAQVKYGYAGDERDALEKLQYEFFYLRHQNVRLDLRIIGRTLRTILGRSGR
jgi:lipopolysaccharide/colanic/teichoic acid biosynthesis glycosyltransferase